MPHAEGLYLDKDGNEVTWEDYLKASEEETGQQPLPQQETIVQEPQAVQQTVGKPPVPTLRARRKPERPALAQKTIVKEPVTEDLGKQPSWLKRNLHYIGAGMFFMACLYIIAVSYVYPAATAVLGRWNYGEAKISHCDLDVGHHGTSHFIAEYWHNQAIVVEFPANHPEQAKPYALRMQPSGDDEPRVVTLRPAYVSQHGKPGYPDLEVYVDGFALPATLYNTGDGFSEEQPS
jgi:hypothetical protein